MFTPSPSMVWNRCAPSIVTVVPVPALTVTVTGADDTVLPAASRATARSVCGPAAANTCTPYGLDVSSAPTLTPSTWNCTAATGPDAVAEMENALATVAPAAGALMVMLIGDSAAVKSTPVASAPLMLRAWLAGVRVSPDLAAVTVYEPLGSPVTTKFPAASAVAVPFTGPATAMVVPAPRPAGDTVPERA